MLQRAKARYYSLEKLTLALISIARKLKLYFQNQHIVVQMNSLIREILHKLDLVRYMVAYIVELLEFGLINKQKKFIKAQALANFLAEMTKLDAK